MSSSFYTRPSLSPVFDKVPRSVMLAGIACVSLGITAHAAQAADPVPRDVFAPAPQAVLDRWQGAYAGLGVSGLIRPTQIDRAAGAAKFSQGTVTVSPSLYAGYNFSTTGRFVWGLEADLAFSGGTETLTDPTLGAFDRRGTILATTRVRAGVEAGRALIYGTAGLAVSNLEIRPSTVPTTDVNWRAGVAVGAGAEFALSDKWSARAEGIYTAFGKQNDIVFNGTQRDVQDSVGQVRLGLTRHF